MCVVFLLLFLLCFFGSLFCVMYMHVPMLPVSRDCPFLIDLSVFSNVYYDLNSMIIYHDEFRKITYFLTFPCLFMILIFIWNGAVVVMIVYLLD